MMPFAFLFLTMISSTSIEDMNFPPLASINFRKAITACADPPLTIGAPAASNVKAITFPIWPEYVLSGVNPV